MGRGVLERSSPSFSLCPSVFLRLTNFEFCYETFSYVTYTYYCLQGKLHSYCAGIIHVYLYVYLVCTSLYVQNKDIIKR